MKQPASGDRVMIPVMGLHDAETARIVVVNWMWFTMFSETATGGTMFTFTNGTTVEVEEDIQSVMQAFASGKPSSDARRRRR